MCRTKIFPLAFVLSLLVTACMNEEFEFDKYDTTVEWEPGLQAPLVYGDLSIDDLLSELNRSDFLSEDDSGLLFFVYDTNTSLSAGDFFGVLPDQEFIQVFFSVPYDLPGDSLENLGDTVLFSQDKSFEFQRTGDERIDSIELKGGEVVIDVSSTIRHTGILKIHSNAIEMNGQPYMQTIEISDPSGTFTDQFIVDLAGTTIALDNSDPDTTLLDLVFDFYLIPSGEDILSSEVVDITHSFRDLEFQTLYGYIGSFDSLLIDHQTMDFDLLEGSFEGTVSLNDPQLHLDIMNSFGVVFSIELLDMEGRFEGGSVTAINIDPADNPIVIGAPGLDQVGESVRTEVSIDRSNSNFYEIGTTDLRGLQFSVRAQANPGGETDNFLQDTSGLSVDVEARIPLDLKIEDVVLADTFEFSPFEDISDIGPEDINSMTLTLDTENGLPLELDVQAYFMDSNYVILDSLFDDTNRSILSSGELDGSGKVIARTPGSSTVSLTQLQIENIWDAQNLLFKAWVETTNDAMGAARDVKFYSEYSLYFKIGAGAEVSLRSD